MKCVGCKGEAEIKILQPFCKECFKKHYLRRVKRLIQKFNMIEKKDKIVVAVSGGKDSLACAQALYSLGFEISVLHIDVGIKECWSPKAKEVTEKFCKEKNIPFYFASFEEFFDIDAKKFFEASRRPICATCGMLKRALFNKFARENNFNKIATGHCADDVAKYFFKSIVASTEESFFWLSKLKPITPSTHKKIVTRIRPILEMLEVENLAFSKFNNINVAGCVMCSYFQRKDKITEILRKIDEKFPDFKIKVVKMLEKINFESEKEIQECEICGEPTKNKICTICKIKKRIEK
ncbi:MAG: adenine nucleotide alpha hydrolase family protein [Candidatus Pacearchaeota archaeon]|nr:adenine nucleotide alpha hydrolase family protein [Candidatus Pacearchaeota archaeon]